MMPNHFDQERIRLEAAQRLPPECFDEFLRLTRTLVHGTQFQWLLVDAAADNLRDQLMAAVDAVLSACGLTTAHLHLDADCPDIPTLEQRIVQHAEAHQAVHVTGGPPWFDAQRWESLNERRERLAAHARARLIFWLDPQSIALAAQHAPDLWAWRSGIYSFSTCTHSETDTTRIPFFPSETFDRGPIRIDNRTMSERHRRIAEIKSLLGSAPIPSDESGGWKLAALRELGDLLFDVGDLDGALVHWQQIEQPFYRQRGDEQAAAAIGSRIANVLEARGQVDEALRMRRDEQLPTFERLGDLHGQAVTHGMIAQALASRGRWDEALQIYQEKVLPAFVQRGDLFEQAVTWGRIADIRELRGETDAALRIREQFELPVYERLNALHAQATTHGKIADLLQARGQYDRALHIRREKELNAYERLGDLRARAITLVKIADVLLQRGQHEEAAVLLEDAVPTLESLGDTLAAAVAITRVGDLCQRIGKHSEALQIYQGRALPLLQQRSDKRNVALLKVKIADVLHMLGRPDEALHIDQNEALPAFIELGDAFGRAATEGKIALLLMDREPPDMEQARELAEHAHAALTQFGVVDAQHLAEEMRRRGVEIARPQKEGFEPPAAT